MAGSGLFGIPYILSSRIGVCCPSRQLASSWTAWTPDYAGAITSFRSLLVKVGGLNTGLGLRVLAEGRDKSGGLTK